MFDILDLWWNGLFMEQNYTERRVCPFYHRGLYYFSVFNIQNKNTLKCYTKFSFQFSVSMTRCT